MNHYGIVWHVPIEKAFAYLTDIEAYPSRYSRYCAKIEVLERSDTFLKTKEFWNISLGQLDHIVVEVEYALQPPIELRYKVVSGYGEGVENRTKLANHPNGTALDVNMVSLDIFKLLYPKKTEVYDDMIDYFVKQDAKILEGKYAGEFGVDQFCKTCKKGKLMAWKREWNQSQDGNETSSREYFKCQYCGKEYSNMAVSVRDEIRFC